MGFTARKHCGYMSFYSGLFHSVTVYDLNHKERKWITCLNKLHLALLVKRLFWGGYRTYRSYEHMEEFLLESGVSVYADEEVNELENKYRQRGIRDTVYKAELARFISTH